MAVTTWQHTQGCRAVCCVLLCAGGEMPRFDNEYKDFMKVRL
jgi:hypothetical protein